MQTSKMLQGVWIDQSSADKIILIRIVKQPTNIHPLSITHCVTVQRDLTWKILVHGHEFNPHHIPHIPSQIQSACLLQQLLSNIQHLCVCAGHPDEHFLEMAESKKGRLLSSKGTIAAYIDRNAAVELNGQTYAATLRASKCRLLTSASKCPDCVAYRDTIRSMHHRWKKSSSKSSLHSTSTSSHVNEKWLNTPERKEKEEKLKKRVKSAENAIRYDTVRVNS